MNDLPVLVCLAAFVAVAVYVAWDMDRPPTRRPKIGRFGMSRIVEAR